MEVGRYTTAELLVLVILLVARGNGSFAQSAIDDVRRAECELLGTNCDNAAPPVAAPAPAAPVQVAPGPVDADWRNGFEPTPGCNSPTEVNGRGSACAGKVIFSDEFINPQKIDPDKWNYEVLMPLRPDFGFVVFDNKNQNSYLKNGFLFIKPTPSREEKLRGTLKLEGCTAKSGGGYGDNAECERKGENHNILPPVYSARITTRNTFSFKYGRVDFRAKLPVGDWIVPEIRLEPKDHVYGSSPFKSGRIQIAMARGNKKLSCDGNPMGNEQVEAGIYVSNGEDAFVSKILKKSNEDQGWGDAFHNYSILWTKDNIEFLIDGESLGPIRSAGHPLYHILGLSNIVAKDWTAGTDMAPFDKEFYISLGVSVGGHNDFPDNCKSDGVTKPWRNRETKAVSKFWERRDAWQKTWKGSHHALQIDFVKVTAL